ncbi:hypothetical protein AZH53_01360 [Methanomicrobiaceae archaeon CYW5]|uniref:flavodoxin domain-containing protein n=1 Tax=Methanovulcanius yangii TaxID=1789227 RepID=UPI0029C9BCD2|nr:flavodoxin domain-containing protein [Methanovulcanius yangii]MBT8507077.1 hypothetical protein [Methanovulcanius yangii]
MCAKKVLVTYATKYGTTEEIAGQIAQILVDSGLDIDLIPVMEVGKVDDYDAIIIGSPVYMGKILVEAREFCKQYKPYLEGKWIAFFVDGVSLCKKDEKSLKSMFSAIDDMLLYILIEEKAAFGGKLNFGVLSESDMQIATMAGAPEGDFSTPEEVRAWATDIAQKITEL